jgi:Sulfotransferase family
MTFEPSSPVSAPAAVEAACRDVSPDWVGPLFLIGMPRSGTKLLRTLLNGHPRISIATVETLFLPALVEQIGRFGDLSQTPHFAALTSWLRQFPYFYYRQQKQRALSDAVWHQACQSFDAAGVFEALVRLDAQAQVGSDIIWGDKSPSYIDHVPTILRTYPKARFIHIIRDARDYALSIHKAWRKNMLRAAQRWNDGIAAARLDFVSNQALVLEIRYEDLLAQPEQTLHLCCEFLGVSFDPAMLKMQVAPENLGDARGARELVASNTNKFAAQMEKTLQQRIEAIAGPMLEAYGYDRAFAPPITRLSPLQLKLYWAADSVNLLRFRIEAMGLRQALKFTLGARRAQQSVRESLSD